MREARRTMLIGLVLITVLGCGKSSSNNGDSSKPKDSTSVSDSTSSDVAVTTDMVSNGDQQTTSDVSTQLEVSVTCIDDSVGRTFSTVGTSTPISVGKLDNLAVCGPQPDDASGDWFKFEVTGNRKQIHVLLATENTADCAIPFVYADENGKPKGQPQDDSLTGIFSSPDDAGPGKSAESHVLDPGTYYIQVLYAPGCGNKLGNGKYSLELAEGCTAKGGDTYCASIHPQRGKFCTEDICVGCKEDKDCPSASPICVEGSCKECKVDTDCKASYFGRKCVDGNFCGCATDNECDAQSGGLECITDVDIPSCGCSGDPNNNPTQGCVKDQTKSAFGTTCALNTCRCIKVVNGDAVPDDTQCTDSPFGTECDESAALCGCSKTKSCGDNKTCTDFVDPLFDGTTQICL